MISATADFIVRFIEVVRHSAATSRKRGRDAAADMLSSLANKLEAGHFTMATATSLFTLTDDVRTMARVRKAKDDIVARLGFDLFYDSPDAFMQAITDQASKGDGLPG